MPKSPSKFLPFFIGILFFLAFPVFCGETLSKAAGLTELQKEARTYRQNGWELQKKGDIEAALAYYQKAILLDPVYPVAYNDIGIILESKGQVESAKEMYLKAVEIAPEYPSSYSNLALLYEGQRNYAKAIEFWMRRAMVGGPSDPWVEVARRRFDEIARVYPEAFQEIKAQNTKTPQ